MSYNRKDNNYYINDNLARNLAYAEPAIKEPQRRKKTETRPQTQPARKTQKGLRANFGLAFTALMVGCAVVLFYFLTSYIALNLQINQKSKQVATKELGMVYASSNQIISYNHATGEYVVQYKDVE